MRKICSRCGSSKSTDDFYKRSASKDGLMAACTDCWNSWRIADYAKRGGDKEKVTYLKNKQAGVYEARRDVINSNARRYIAKDREGARKRVQVSSAKARHELNDSYIRHGFFGGLDPEAVPSELLELKRLVLSIKRFLKESKP